MSARQATYTFAPEERPRRERFRVGNIFQLLATLLLLGLFVLTLVGVVIIYKEYRLYQSLRSEVGSLEHQVTVLSQEYHHLTSKKVVLKKASRLGLHPPKPEQIVELRMR